MIVAEFSMSAPSGIYKEQYEEYLYWFKGVKVWFILDHPSQWYILFQIIVTVVYYASVNGRDSPKSDHG